MSATLIDSAAPGPLRRLLAGSLGRMCLALLVLSLAVIGGALVFEYAVGLVPCELCLAERRPWYAAIPLSALFLVWQPGPARRLVPALFVLLFLGSAAFALYHVGVEQHVFAGPTACTGVKLTGSMEEMTRQLMAAPPVRCDEVQWSLFGISLAGWNAVASLAGAGLAARGWLQGRRGRA